MTDKYTLQGGIMTDCCDRDECVQDDEPWDCACYSHNEPGSDTHEKNPAFKGMTHRYVIEHEQELLMWDNARDAYTPRAYVKQ
jgi:hypothetical protein